MGNGRVDEFLDLYKRLEQLLKTHYYNDSGRYESVVARYENSRESGELKDEITAIREIRNLIQHNPKIKGRYIIEPSEEIMKALKRTKIFVIVISRTSNESEEVFNEVGNAAGMLKDGVVIQNGRKFVK